MAIGFIMSYGYLATLVAAASIGIIGENYARSIRLWVGFQAYAIFVVIGLIGWWTDASDMAWSLAFALMLTGLHWAATGVFMVSQSGSISPRTQRTLPERLSSRMLFSWLIPGGGTGYFFVILNYASLMLAFVLMPLEGHDSDDISLYLVVTFGYVAFFLGILRLAMLAIPSTATNRAGVGALLGVLCLALGSGIPIFLSMAANDFERWTYETYSVFNVFATYEDIYEARGAPVSLLLVCAAVVLMVNALLVSRDIILVRVRSIEDRDGESTSVSAASPAVDPFA